MGRGDKRSRRGKIFAGSFGKTRMKTKKKFYPAVVAVAVDAVAPVKVKKAKKIEE
jgi:ribosomal small subunit protein bTHX